ncbi:hypothetical protein AB0I10_02420 [Streptomyces sp. NPDC050636]|uniref:hypothetical protein n=1 Tax=Streptomyces sp. NPDC050636 TaxID=3154510 RepID=UPI0034306346
MPPVGMPAPAPRKNTGRTCLTAALAVFGALGLLAGGGLIAHTYSNHSQNIANASDYGPSMWRNQPATKLFPETLAAKLDYQSDATDRKRAQWHRIGISDNTGCDDGLSGATAKEAKRLGCKAALRATYVDPTGNTLVTVALIVLPKGTDPESMHAFFSGQQDRHPLADAVKAYRVPGTVAANWSDGQRNGTAGNSVNNSDLPYALAASAGATDGRKAGRLPGEWGGSTTDAREDRGSWEGAATSLTENLESHLTDLLLEETT